MPPTLNDPILWHFGAQQRWSIQYGESGRQFGFLQDDAKLFLEARLAKTYLLCDEDKIVGYYCLLNDKLSRQEVANSEWRKIKKLFPHSKHFGSYPAVKIGRFAISVHYRGQGWGNELMDAIKRHLKHDTGYSSFRFLTVDPIRTLFLSTNGTALKS